jgi:hypothetical protein
MSVLELFLFCVVFYASSSEVSGLALGLSLSKYSFGPVYVSSLLFRRRFYVLAIALAMPAAGLLAVWMMLGGSLTHLAAEPLAVSRIRVWPGMADLMTGVESGAAVWLSVGYGFLLSRRQLTRGAEFTLVAVASLMTVKHLMYDYVFLVVPVGYALSRAGKSVRRVVLAIAGVFWFLTRLFPALPIDEVPKAYPLAMMFAGAGLMGVLLVTLTQRIFADAEIVSNPPSTCRNVVLGLPSLEDLAG